MFFCGFLLLLSCLADVRPTSIINVVLHGPRLAPSLAAMVYMVILRTADDNWHLGVVEDVIADRAQERPPERPRPSRPYHNHFNVLLFSRVDYGLTNLLIVLNVYPFDLQNIINCHAVVLINKLMSANRPK